MELIKKFVGLLKPHTNTQEIDNFISTLQQQQQQALNEIEKINKQLNDINKE